MVNSHFPTTSIVIERQMDSGAVDAMGEIVYVTAKETVKDVLFAPTYTNDLEAKRPEGDRLQATFYLPKTYTASHPESLAGASILCAGHRWRVVGDPLVWIDPPGDWDMAVGAVSVHG